MILPDYRAFKHHFATSGTLGPDGYEVWPVAKLRSGGFDGGLTGIPKPILAFPLTISCNAQAADGGAAFDWYISQRTDDPARQPFAVTKLSDTQSGSIVLSLTARAVADLGLASATSPLNEGHLRSVLRNCHLYVQRRSDDAIQWVDMLRYTLTSV